MNLRAYRASLLKLNFVSVPPLMQNQRYKNERVFQNNGFISKSCWDIHCTFTCSRKIWKQGWKGQEEKYLSIFQEVLANNIWQSTASISKSLRLSKLWPYCIEVNQRSKLSKTEGKLPNMALLLRAGNSLVDFIPLNSIKILKLPLFELTIKSENMEWSRKESNLFSRLCGIYHWISQCRQSQILQKYGSYVNYGCYNYVI